MSDSYADRQDIETIGMDDEPFLGFAGDGPCHSNLCVKCVMADRNDSVLRGDVCYEVFKRRRNVQNSVLMLNTYNRRIGNVL